MGRIDRYERFVYRLREDIFIDTILKPYCESIFNALHIDKRFSAGGRRGPSLLLAFTSRFLILTDLTVIQTKTDRSVCGYLCIYKFITSTRFFWFSFVTCFRCYFLYTTWTSCLAIPNDGSVKDQYAPLPIIYTWLEKEQSDAWLFQSYKHYV